MFERKYEVLIDGKIEATEMTLDTAMVLVKALLHEYFREPALTISVREMAQSVKGMVEEMVS